jgi:Na+/H+-dicarboxylate symporter
LKDQSFLIIIILSAILGLGFGFLIKNFWEMSPIMITYIGLPGKLVIRAFMMVLVPLIVASITTSISYNLIFINVFYFI